MNKILSVTLNPSIDKTLTVEAFRAGREERVRSVRSVAGGKGVNFARALAALRQPSVSLILGDVLPQAAVRVNTSVVDAAGQFVRFLEPGPELSRADWRRVVSAVESRAGYDVVALCGSLPEGAPAGLYAELIGHMKRRGVRVILDASREPLALGVKAGPWCVKPNRAEAQAVLGMTIRSLRSLRKALQMLAGYGITKVLVSLGEEGLAGFDGREMVLARVECRRGMTTGCGDAALAGFVAAFERGRCFADALRCAAAAGAANVGLEIPGKLNREVVGGMYKSVTIERLGYVDH